MPTNDNPLPPVDPTPGQPTPGSADPKNPEKDQAGAPKPAPNGRLHEDARELLVGG